MADLYDDLDTTVGGRSSVQLKTELQEMKDKYEKIKNEAATLQRLNKELAAQNAILEKNMSVLFATAQTEITRKDNTIKQLRDDVHRLTSDRTEHSRRTYPPNQYRQQRREYD